MYKVFFQIVAILLPLTLSGCLNKEQYKQKQLDKVQTCVNQFRATHRVDYLDSALLVMNQVVEQFPEYRGVASYKIAEIYYLKKDYEQALAELENAEEGVYSKIKPIWKTK